MFGIVTAIATKVATAAAVVTAKVITVLSGTSASTPALELNFDPSQMFSYTNVITDSLMPLVYISAGFALGFSIIYMLKNAFSGRL